MRPVRHLEGLPRRLDAGRPTAKVQQQIVESQRRRHPRVFAAQIAAALDRNAVGNSTAGRVLAAGNRHAEIEGWQIGRLGLAQQGSLLTGIGPCLTGLRVVTERLLDHVDQIPLVGLPAQNPARILPGLHRRPSRGFGQTAMGIQRIIRIRQQFTGVYPEGHRGQQHRPEQPGGRSYVIPGNPPFRRLSGGE